MKMRGAKVSEAIVSTETELLIPTELSMNVAVANEVLGNNVPALDWAQKSYELYNDKLGLDYAKILLQRKRIEGLKP